MTSPLNVAEPHTDDQKERDLSERVETM
jgi:hypothetical protein